MEVKGLLRGPGWQGAQRPKLGWKALDRNAALLLSGLFEREKACQPVVGVVLCDSPWRVLRGGP